MSRPPAREAFPWTAMAEEFDEELEQTPAAPEPNPLMREKARPATPEEKAQWPRPWAQLKFVTFQPAIFPRMLGDVSRDARPGDFVAVYDKFGNRIGAGLYNPRAKMPLRVVTHTAEAVGEEYFETALRRAVALRRDLFKLDEVTDAYRVVGSDGDGLSGLTIDRYGDTLFCDVYSLGIFQRLPQWLPLLHELLGTKHVRVHVDHDLGSLEGIKPSMMKELTASAPDKVRIREHGVRFEVDFAEGHKTGFFCDQRDNRRRFGQLAKGLRVLDLCSYTGGFSINAAIGGASEVTAVDLDEKAVAQGRRNANLNQVSPNKLKWVHADAFAYARQMQKNGEQFDLVMCDPPKFVMTREPAGAAEGMRKYADLNTIAASLVKPGGLFVTCSCSGLVSLEDFEQVVIKGVHRLNRRLQLFDRTGPGVDHPVYSNCLESRYLKVLWARVV
ncbi:class I SAM-dependent rRNA methyltransferase [Oleiharenicola sp. Vm1]|uniref:class I SAM-dependent rRNA methyltransferase n=1 Tax=Oleiharenicola sp. Vm1 TaxID=3398393 RepID=UPI0039F57F39